MMRLQFRMTFAITVVVFIAALGPVAGALLFVVGRAFWRSPLSALRDPEAYLNDRWLIEFDAGIELVVSELFDETSRAILTATVLTLIMGVAAGSWVGRYFARPIGDLADAAERVRAGDLGHHVELRDRSREVQALASEFNQMSTQLRDANDRRRQLLSDVSHELRTPLTVLELNLRGILDEMVEPDEVTVVNLYGQTAHVIGLVEDLHLLATADDANLQLNIERFDLSELLNTIGWNFETVASEQACTLRYPLPSEFLLEADPSRIRQMVGNLLSNALRHTGAGGDIELELDQSGTDVLIRVRDTGDGIAAEELEHLFDRHWRGPAGAMRDSGGSGLGLAIVKSLAQAHNGSVTASSEGIGRGSVFELRIPIKIDGTASTTSAPSRGTGLPAKLMP